MNYLFIILPAIAIASVVILYVLTRNAQEIEEDELPPVIKFQPRKVVDLSVPSSINLAKKDVTPVSTEAAIAPKKKKNYYKKKTKRSE
jgi:hypothetical protein